MFEYKTIPSPPSLIVRGKKYDDAAIRAYSDLINREATDGWEFYGMEPISVIEPKGCLSLSQPRSTTYYMLVFRRVRG